MHVGSGVDLKRSRPQTRAAPEEVVVYVLVVPTPFLRGVGPRGRRQGCGPGTAARLRRRDETGGSTVATWTRVGRGPGGGVPRTSVGSEIRRDGPWADVSAKDVGMGLPRRLVEILWDRGDPR